MNRILGTVFAALLGLAFGSFLNVCLTRWPAGESIVKPRSHCRNCDRTLAWWENVPLLSWLALRGRCSTCGTWIGWRYPLVELAVGALWAISAWRYVPAFLEKGDSVVVALYYSVDLAGTLMFSWLLVALAALDAENYWLPDSVTIPGIILGILLVIAKSVLNTVSPFHDTVYGSELKMITVEAGQAAIFRLLEILAAASLILLFRWLYKLIRHREGLGLGDAKLMAMLAAWLGLPGALLSFAIGVAVGSLAAIVLLARRSKPPTAESWATAKLPLGTFLCIGGIVSSLWGQLIISSYLRWAGF